VQLGDALGDALLPMLNLCSPSLFFSSRRRQVRPRREEKRETPKKKAGRKNH